MFKRTLFIIAVFFPFTAFAQVMFTEVMYDLEAGSDSGREWVEIKNTGTSSVDLSSYRFREGETNHTLVVYQGSGTLAAGGVAIIADNPAKFLIDNPSFSGTIFDSSFSLSNTGETLALKDSSLVDVDQFTYSSDLGGNGDGKSLQKIEGNWLASLPTPGTVGESTGVGGGAGSSLPPSSSSSSSSSTEPSSGASSAVSGSSFKWPVEPQIYSYAGEDKTVTVGTPSEFIGEALGIDKKPLQGARYLWSFGDGASSEGKHVLHTYSYPGVYVVVLDVSAGEFSNSDKLTVKVVEANLALFSGQDSLGGFLEVENLGVEEVNLSYWQLLSSGALFTLPKGTILLPRKSVRFPQVVTGLSSSAQVELRYPNGSFALSGGVRYGSSSVPVVATKVSPPDSSSASLPAKPPLKKEKEKIPESSPASAVANAPLALSTSSSIGGYLGEYKWFYLLGALLGLTALGVFFLGRSRNEEIEIIEDPS